MIRFAEKPQQNKTPHVAQLKKEEHSSQLAANGPEAAVQRKLQETIDGSSRTAQLKAIQKKADQSKAAASFGGAPIQLAAANVVGRTHLVGMNHGSIMTGQQGELLQNGTALDVDQHTRIISRRGPNQELVADYDHRGRAQYRWYKVDVVGQHNITAQNMYIREHTFRFQGNEGDHHRAHGPLAPERTRKSHVAIKLQVWYNENRAIDATGHMLMADYSHRHNARSMYEYTWGADTPITEGAHTRQPVDGRDVPFDHRVGRVDPMTMGGDSASSTIDSEGLGGIGPKSKHKALVHKQETPSEKHASMTGQRRYLLPSGKYGMNPPANQSAAAASDAPVSVPRFNRVKSVEILVTMPEYRNLMRMYHLRQRGGFYCFYREARTVHGYQLATRCLSFLEDIAIMRRQHQLQPGHAADVLRDFALINGVTVNHQGEHNA